jgi:hypothetical protein
MTPEAITALALRAARFAGVSPATLVAICMGISGALVKTALKARLEIDAGFVELGETTNYDNGTIGKIEAELGSALGPFYTFAALEEHHD